jgi:hypothetical protein
MSYSHRVSAYRADAPDIMSGAASKVRLRATPLPITKPANVKPARTTALVAAARPKALTRRFETMWLNERGEVEDSLRIAPATVLFEEAFSALARGAILHTEAGRIAVEDLVPGMRVITSEGGARTVTWIGSMQVYPTTHEGQDPVTLTRFTADALGHAKPMQDLILGPRARVLLRDVRCRNYTGEPTAYVPARAFIDGVSVIEVTPASPVTVFHIALERQATLKIGGMEVESYHPGQNIETMMEPRMFSLFKDLFQHVKCLSDFGPLAHERLTKFEVDAILG